MRIGPYLFHKEKCITQFKIAEKNDKSPYWFAPRENDDFPLMARSSCKEKAAIFNARALITREFLRSRNAQCNAWKDLKISEWLSKVIHSSKPSVIIVGDGRDENVSN